MNETLKAIQLLREVRDAEHEFDEEYLSKALEYLEMAIKKGE